MTDIVKNIQTIKEKIIFFETKYARVANSVSLLAVSKKQSIEKILLAILAGQLKFGENYLQEALDKVNFFKINHPEKNIEWHFIGKLQTNKTRKIAENFAWVHCVDDAKIAQRLNDQRPEYLPPLNICLAINLDNESSKSGVSPGEVKQLADFCHKLPQIKLRGLMALPAPKTDFNQQRESFSSLGDLLKIINNQDVACDTLSIGTSQDWEAAIASGATIVRIGERVFGNRG